MGRAPCCDEVGVKKGPWTTEEDKQLVDYIEKNGYGSWRQLPKLAGLNRCGKSCRLRWTNYLRPDIKRGSFTEEEERLVIHLHSVIGNKWSQMANRLPGRTDNEIKNYWNTHLRKKLLQMGIDPVTHRPRTDLNLLTELPHLLNAAVNIGNMTSGSWNQNYLRLQTDVLNQARLQFMQELLRVMSNTSTLAPYIGNYQFNGLHNHFNGLHIPINLTPSGFTNLDLRNVYNLQDSTESSFSLDRGFSVENNMDSNGGNSSHSTTINNDNNTRGTSTTLLVSSSPEANSTPLLVSASPEANSENIVTNQAEERITSKDLYTQLPALSSFDTWEGLNLDDLDNVLSWDSILDQTSKLIDNVLY